MEGNNLYILWTGKDKEEAQMVVFRYMENVIEKREWQHIVLLLWGPSEKLVAEDPDINKKLTDLMQKDVTVKACIICADEYGVTDKLLNMGIQLETLSDTLTQIIKLQKAFVTL